MTETKYWVGALLVPADPFATFVVGELVGEWEKGPILKNIFRWAETPQGFIPSVDFVFSGEAPTPVDKSLYAMSRLVDSEAEPKLLARIERTMSEIRAARSGLVTGQNAAPTNKIEVTR